MNTSKLIVENWRWFINEQDASLGRKLLQVIQGIEGFEKMLPSRGDWYNVHITNVGSRGERQQLMNTLAEKFPRDVEPLTDPNAIHLRNQTGRKIQR